MTTLGKVLVFVILILSLGNGYLEIMAFTARTHWAKANDELKKQNEVTQASNAAFAQQAVTAQQDAAAKVAEANKRVEGAAQEAADLRSRLATAVNDFNQQKAAIQQSQTSLQASQEESRRRQQDVLAMQATVKQYSDERQKYIEAAAKARDDKVAAEIQANTLTRLNGQLEKQVQEDQKLIQTLQSRGSGSAPVPGGTRQQSNPPPEDVEGRVVTSDPSGYLKLSIGSDSGLAEGHTLELFRLSPPKYLGRVRVVRVTAHESVAQPVGKPSDKPVVGDLVRSRLSGGG